MLLCEGVFADPVSTEKVEKKSSMPDLFSLHFLNLTGSKFAEVAFSCKFQFYEVAFS